jgi:uncharacterized repeat protein (TIGR01451 family)
VTVTCPKAILAVAESMDCTASGTAITGPYSNTGTASGSYTDDAGHSRTDTESDNSSYFGAAPSIQIVKTFTDDHVIAGGDASSFTLVVTNNGNVALSNVSVADTVDPRLQVTGVTTTKGTCATPSQNISCAISSLAVNESATITVNFNVGPSVPAAATVSNSATASSTYTDSGGHATTVTNTGTDTVEIKIDINLSIVKTFVPTELTQGKTGTFTLVVSNAGPSDAVGVAVTDTVYAGLEVTGVTVTSGTGDCTASSGQEVNCTVQIPDESSVTITVTYTAAPAVPPGDPIFGTTAGDEFRFIFVNGSILEGSTDGGPVYLNGVDITDDVSLIAGLTRNDILFNPPLGTPIPGVDDPAFLMHLSCSDRFIGGWGESDGPMEGVDVNWQIASYSISRYNQNGFIKACGDTPVPFEVPNQGSAIGTDSFGPDSSTNVTSNTATVTIMDPSLVFPENDAVDFKNRDVYFKLVSKNPEDMLITQVEVSWPWTTNGNLTTVALGKNTIWTGNAAGTLDPNNLANNKLVITAFTGQQSSRILQALQKEKLRFTFAKRPVADPDRVEYTFIVTFADGTDVSITTPYP